MKRIFKNVMIPMLNISGGLKNCGDDEEKIFGPAALLCD